MHAFVRSVWLWLVCLIESSSEMLFCLELQTINSLVRSRLKPSNDFCVVLADIDECAILPKLCDALTACTNTVGNFTCSPCPGYVPVRFWFHLHPARVCVAIFCRADADSNDAAQDWHVLTVGFGASGYAQLCCCACP